MKLLYAENIVSLSVKSDVLPWDWTPTVPVPDAVRADKPKRQAWYKKKDTKHYFYTGVEGSNPNMRASVTNPPRVIHAFVGDYDIPNVPWDTIIEATASMPVKPSWYEKSLGGNFRLVWLLETPLVTGDEGLTSHVLLRAIDWLGMKMLPALDEGATKSFSRLFCRGDEWTNLGHPPICAAEVHAFFVGCCRQYDFKGETGYNIPLATVEEELKQKYPNFSWPSDFTVESKGPTFWIPESLSPMSAIVKANGIFTFAAHAEKPFYTWADLLGGEFVREFATCALEKATSDIWHDGVNYWRKIGEEYWSFNREGITGHLSVTCKLSSKKDPNTGSSMLAEALEFIHNHNRVKGAGSFVFNPVGIMNYQGSRVLNCRALKPIQPAPEDDQPRTWGQDWPFILKLLSGLFDPPVQLDYFYAWHQRLYESALRNIPRKGHNIVLCGEPGIGKTFWMTRGVGASVGGMKDASSYLVQGGSFGGEMFGYSLWGVDDDTPGATPASRARFQASLKRMSANSNHVHSQKYQVPTDVDWTGRIYITMNADDASAQIIPALDDGSADKLCLFRCARKPFMDFKNEADNLKALETELPFYLRDLLKWEAPPHVIPEARYGFQSYHDPSMVKLSQQVNQVTPVAEVFEMALSEFFRDNPTVAEWRGTASEILMLVQSFDHLARLVRTVNSQNIFRFLQNFHRSQLLPCTTEESPGGRRIWVFKRLDTQS